MRRKERGRIGFSLTEVILALGIVSFALVALLGLFSIGLNASKQAREDTEISSMAGQVISGLRNSSTVVPTGTTNYYFDVHGQQVNMTKAANAYYECQLTTRYLQASEISPDTTTVILATLTFTWPSAVPRGKRPYTNSVYASLK